MHRMGKKRNPARRTTGWPARLKDLRARHNLTQAAAALRVGVALRTWISWENAHRSPSGPAATLLRIAFPSDFAK
jgi:DNA-binding transcriptional regulator YiaG